VKKYPAITILEGHYEYEEMVGTKYWLEVDPSYRTKKDDPGPIFMNAVRQRVADLHLLAPKDVPKNQTMGFLESL